MLTDPPMNNICIYTLCVVNMTSDQVTESRSSIDSMVVFCSHGFLFELLDAFCNVVVVYGTLEREFLEYIYIDRFNADIKNG